MILNFNQKYYFWDKKLNKLGSFVIYRFTKNFFYFNYLGHSYRCEKKYAENKIFENPNEIPEYREMIQKEYDYTPNHSEQFDFQQKIVDKTQKIYSLTEAQDRGAYEKSVDDNGYFTNKSYVQRWDDYHEQV